MCPKFPPVTFTVFCYGFATGGGIPGKDKGARGNSGHIKRGRIRGNSGHVVTPPRNTPWETTSGKHTASERGLLASGQYELHKSGAAAFCRSLLLNARL